MARTYATAARVGRDEQLDFLAECHRATLTTRRRDGRLQMSPVSCGGHDGRILISTYPRRAKAVNARRDPRVSLVAHSDEWNGPYVQVDGRASVLDMPAALDGLVDYFRCISGEHPDWNEYREAMAAQDKSLLSIDIEAWGPIATGGFPPEMSER